MSGGSVDSIRVNTALLAAESQYTHQNRSTWDQDLPVSSRPPIHHAERPYGHIRRRRRCSRIKFKAIKVSQAPEVETTYQRRPSAALPPRKDSKCAYGVNRPRRHHGRIKIEPGKLKIECLDDKTAQKGETTYRRRARLAQPLIRAQKCCWEVHGLRHLRGGSKSRPRNVSRT